MNKIKLDDLVNWVDRNSEDPIIDGPYYFTPTKGEIFMKEFNQNFRKEFLDAIVEYDELDGIDDISVEHFVVDLEDFQDTTEFNIIKHLALEDDEDYEEYIWTKFVETLNTLGYENLFVE